MRYALRSLFVIGLIAVAGCSDALVGSWASDYLTAGQSDTFTMHGDLTGQGTYNSVLPGVACPVDIAAKHASTDGSYSGTLLFRDPCTGSSTFDCSLDATHDHIACSGGQSYHRTN